MLLTSDNIGDIVSFSVFPSSIIGTAFQRVKIKAFLDAETASMYVDTQAQHVAVYPTLPATTPDDPKKYPWVKVELENGTSTVVGLPWIDPATVVLNENTQIQVTLSGVSAADVPKIRNALVMAGFNQMAIDLL